MRTQQSYTDTYRYRSKAYAEKEAPELGMNAAKIISHTLTDCCCMFLAGTSVKYTSTSSDAQILCWQGGLSLALRGQQGVEARPESMLSWPAAWE